MNLKQKNIIKPKKETVRKPLVLGKKPIVLKIVKENIVKTNKPAIIKNSLEANFIRITPVIDPKRIKKCEGTFYLNINYTNKKDIIRVGQGTIIEGSLTTTKEQEETIKQIEKDMKYNDSNSFYELTFNDKTNKYKISFLQDTLMAPAKIAKYINGSYASGWISFKDSDGNLIQKYQKM